MTKETHRGMWGALRPAIRRTSAEELLHARRTETKTSEPAPHTGAFGRIVADVPTRRRRTRPAYRLRTRRPRTQQTPRTGCRHPRTHPHQRLHRLRCPSCATRRAPPKNPTLSDLNRETMQRAAEAEAAAAAEAENAAEAETVATAEAASAFTAGRKYRTETTRTGHTHAVADPNAPLSSLAASPEAAERAAAREDAVEDTRASSSSAQPLIALTVPLTVLMIAIRA